MNMSDIILVKNNKCFIDSEGLAELSNNEHRAVVKLIKNYATDLEYFGVLTPSVSKPTRSGGRPKTIYLLNEQQATLLTTFMTNSPTVRKFKIKLVEEFDKQNKVIQQLISQQKNPDWMNVRKDGKQVYFQKTDVIKDFINYAIEQGSKSAKMYYMNFAKMENKALFVFEQKYPNLREVLTIRQLMQVSIADDIIEKAIKEGMENKLFYKDIFKECKKRIIKYVEIIGQSPILGLESK